MAAVEVQTLLRFLTKDARLPLQEAMSKVNALRKQDLGTPEQISKADPALLKEIFTGEKVDYVKQVINAAKRVSNPKKRGAAPKSSPASKRIKSESERGLIDEEASLALPSSDCTTDELENITIETNRAPSSLPSQLLS